MSIPEHRKLYEMLRRHILEGRYKPGDLLPSENYLCALQGITRPTVRKALDKLCSDGFITRKQGKGSIIRGSHKGIGILALSSTTNALQGENLQTTMLIPPQVLENTESLGFELSELEKSGKWIYFERLRLMDERPVLLDITAIPEHFVPGFCSINLENKSLFDLLRKKFGIQITGGTQQLMAIRANKKLQLCFEVKAGHPILQLNRRMDTSNPGLHIYSQIFCISDQYALIGTF